MSIQMDLSMAMTLGERFKAFKDHQIPLKEFQEKYNTSHTKGLTKQQAAKRLKMVGPNVAKTYRPHILFLMREFRSTFSLLLWTICAFYVIGCCIWTDLLILEIGFTAIVMLIVLTSCVNFFRPSSNHSDEVQKQLTVIRQGTEVKIKESELVPGDLVKIRVGNSIPADLRVVEEDGLKIDASAVTGERELLQRQTDPSSDNFVQSENVALASTICREGSGKGLVMLRGEESFIGIIKSLQIHYPTGENYGLFKLSKKERRIINRLAAPSIVLGVVIYGIRYYLGVELITLIKGSVEEGL